MKLISLVLVCSALAAPALAADRPNLLWITLEDSNPVFGCMGDPVNAGHTAHVDALAARGTRFSRAYSPAPVCSPARSAMITGAMQTTFGLHQHRSSRRGDDIELADGVTTVPELLRELGYFTFNQGKDDYNFVHHRPDLYAKVYGKRPWNLRQEGQPFFGQIQLRGGKHYYTLKNGKQTLETPVPRGAVDVPPYLPDIPVIREQFALHADTGRVTDREVGGILERLSEKGILANTIVFFFSDHGMPNSVRHKQFCYEGGVHVPLVIAGPGVPEGSVRRDLVSLLDVAATTLALAGREVPWWFEGRNLFAADHEPRTHVISARDRCDYTIDRIRTVRTEHHRYIKNFLVDRPWMQPQYRDGMDFVEGVRQLHAAGELDEVAARFYGDDRPDEELYDLRVDPHQIDNLVEDPAHAAELRRHRELLDSWIERTGDRGQFPESDTGLRAVLARWKDACVNPEYDRVRSR